MQLFSEQEANRPNDNILETFLIFTQKLTVVCPEENALMYWGLKIFVDEIIIFRGYPKEELVLEDLRVLLAL